MIVVQLTLANFTDFSAYFPSIGYAHRVEMSKNVITLKGKSGVKSLGIEYVPASNTGQQGDQSTALDWYISLSVCVDRANGRRRLS